MAPCFPQPLGNDEHPLQVGTMQTVFMEPLDENLSFEPDVVVVYGNVAQTSRSIAAANFRKGSGVEGGPLFSLIGPFSHPIFLPFHRIAVAKQTLRQVFQFGETFQILAVLWLFLPMRLWWW